jgi:hypothetical protein
MERRSELKDGKLILHCETVVFIGKAFIPREREGGMI